MDRLLENSDDPLVRRKLAKQLAAVGKQFNKSLKNIIQFELDSIIQATPFAGALSVKLRVIL